MLVPSTRMLRASGNELVGCHTCFAVSSARLELSQLQPQTPTIWSEPHMQGHSHSRIQQWLNRSHLSCVPIWPELSLALQAYSCSRRQPRCNSGCRIYDVTIELLCCHVQQQPWSPLVFSEPLRCPPIEPDSSVAGECSTSSLCCHAGHSCLSSGWAHPHQAPVDDSCLTRECICACICKDKLVSAMAGQVPI